MKSAVRWALVIVGVIVGVIVLGGLSRRSSWHVEAVEHVRAPPEAVFHEISDLRKWAGWTFWTSATDPAAKFEFDDHAPGTGQKMRWQGERLGDGELTITAADPRTGVVYAEKTGHFAIDGRIALELEQGGTKVTWSEGGDVGWNLPARFALATLESELRPELGQSLARLKTLVEATQPGRLPEGAPPPPPPSPAEAR